jgi:ribosomal protein S18 acetylase RimI-like enzyme
VGIGVRADARGAGHGRALLERFEAEARARRMAALELSVYPENETARRSYARSGWLPSEGHVPAGTAMYYSKEL